MKDDKPLFSFHKYKCENISKTEIANLNNEIEKTKEKFITEYDKLRNDFPVKFGEDIERAISEANEKGTEVDPNEVKSFILSKVNNLQDLKFDDFDDIIKYLQGDLNFKIFKNIYETMIHGFNEWSLKNLSEIDEGYNTDYIKNSEMVENGGRSAINLGNNDNLIGFHNANITNTNYILKDLETLRNRIDEIQGKVDEYNSWLNGESEDLKEKKEISTYGAFEKFSKLEDVKEVKTIINDSALELGDFCDLHKEADLALKNDSNLRKKAISDAINSFKNGNNGKNPNFSDIVDQLENLNIFKGRVSKVKKYAYACIKKNDNGTSKVCLAMSGIDFSQKGSFVSLRFSTVVNGGEKNFSFTYKVPDNIIILDDNKTKIIIDYNGKVSDEQLDMIIDENQRNQIANIQFPKMWRAKGDNGKLYIDNRDPDIILKNKTLNFGVMRKKNKAYAK